MKNKKEEEKKTEKGGKTKNQTTENAVGQTVVAQKTNVLPEAHAYQLTTEDQTSFKNFLRANPNIFMELLYIEWAGELRRNDARRSSDPYCRSVLSAYSVRTAYTRIRRPTLSAASVLSAQAYCLLPTHVFPYRIRTLYTDSSKIRTVIWSAERVRRPWTE